MIYGYIRVSTDKQTAENQRFEIKKFCKGQKIKTDRWIEETISGAKDFEKRKLGFLIKNLKKGDLIICTEISRLGRNLFQIMQILNLCMQKEAKIWTIKDNYRLGADLQSKVLAFAFALRSTAENSDAGSAAKTKNIFWTAGSRRFSASMKTACRKPELPACSA